MKILTARLVLRPWASGDASAFAELHADPEVMADEGGPLCSAEYDAKLARYMSAYGRSQFCRWAVETKRGDFIGYAGGMPVPGPHPLGDHIEIGWRLKRSAWGYGYATEAARTALGDLFGRIGLNRVFAYTAAENLRSVAVMNRLGLERERALDFVANYDRVGLWRGSVWIAKAETNA